MPLEYSDLWGGKEFRDLADLPLPGPALVIDVRHSVEDKGRLIWYLAIEVEDLAREMRLNKVRHWRHLAECIDFLKIDASLPDPTQDKATEFMITTRVGDGVRQGQSDLAHYIGREHIDRVRRNRIYAAKDEGESSREQARRHANAEQTKVRVIFLADLEDRSSLSRAATYTRWLKAWSNEVNGPPAPGRDSLIEVIAFCMHADLHRHQDFLKDESLIDLDMVILMESYRDDAAYMGREAQIHQAELVLYTLLLYWPASLESTGWKTVDDPDDLQTLPWPAYVVGTSALEYSARWGSRWLDYGLAAQIIATLREPLDVRKEEKQLQIEVQTWWDDWWHRFKQVVPAQLTKLIPEFKVFDTLQGLMNATQYPSSDMVQNLDTFCQQVKSLYTGTSSMSLERTLDSGQRVLWLLEQNRTPAPAANGHATAYDGLKKLTLLQLQAQLFLVPLFHGSKGAFARAQRQLSLLNMSIAPLRQLEKMPPDLHAFQRQFEQEAGFERQRLQALARKGGFQWGKKQMWQREWQAAHDKLCATINTHLSAVREAIAANAALALLQWADLCNPDGPDSLYQQRLQQLGKELEKAQEQAQLQQKMADKRLRLGIEPQTSGTFSQPTWLSLNNRNDLLNWSQVTESFVKTCTELKADPVLIDLLAEMLLRQLGAEKPRKSWQQDDQDQVARVRRVAGKEEFQAIGTTLVSALLSAKIGKTNPADVFPLLDEYAQQKDLYLEGPSVLGSEVLDVRRILKDAQLEQAMQNTTGVSTAIQQELAVDFVLASWIRNQHVGDPALSEALDSRNMIAQLEERDGKTLINNLGRQNRLFGSADEIAGTDYFYLLLAPSNMGNEFLSSLDKTQAARIHAIHFPDIEKVIYLHIHRIRQL